MAAVLSEKISRKGIVFANKYNVGGGDKTFAGMLDKITVFGWRTYQDGMVISTDIPETLTM